MPHGIEQHSGKQPPANKVTKLNACTTTMVATTATMTL